MRKFVLNPPVAIGSLTLIAALLIFGGFWPETAARVFNRAHGWILDTFGWFYILAVAVFLGVALFMALSRFGNLKLGPDDSTPDFPYTTWLAMLFAAGMGIGLMYYAVAEPIQHFTRPPEAEPRSVAAERQAMVHTLFHWGVHAWAVYGVVGLSLGYFGYRYNLPLTIRSGLYPLLKDRINGPAGHAIDIFAICSTVFGISTSLGLGILQINAGLAYLFDVPISTRTQVILIAIVMGIAALSVLSGLDVGIRRLSELNLSLAIVLMLFVLAVGPTVLLLQSFVQNIGLYLGSIVPQTFNMYAYRPTQWIEDWTLFYWAWWIAWSPFVGMFIARISRGRTVREFVLGVLIAPTVVTSLWMTVFGNSALHFDIGVADGALAAAVDENVSLAIFKFFEYLPWTNLTSGLAILLVAIFFVTSADSGSLVIDTLASGGREDTPAVQRLFWAALQGAVAAILHVAGGLAALQTATIAAALPFAVVILLLCFGLFRGMAADLAHRDVMAEQVHIPHAKRAMDASWTRRLGSILRAPRQGDVEQFVDEVVAPALDAVADEFGSRGMEATAQRGDHRAWLTVVSKDLRNFVYGVEMASRPVAGFGLRDVSDRGVLRRSFTATTFFGDGRRGYDVMGMSHDALIADILDQYEGYRALVESPASRLFIASPDSSVSENDG